MEIHAVHKPVAGIENTVVNKKPALVCFNRGRTRANFFALPRGTVFVDCAHYIAMFPPKGQVGTLAAKNIAKRRVTCVARAAEHRVHIINFARKQHAVAVIRQKCVFQLIKFFKIKCVTDSDGRAVVTVAPCR